VELGKQVKLRSIDVKVLEGLALYGPRKLSKLAAAVKMPDATLRRRINYLRSHFSLFLLGSLYHTNIGLRKALVFAKSKPGHEELLFQCLKSNDYWLYVSQCIGGPTCLAIYGIPAGKEREFEEFLGELEDLDQMCKVDFFWTTCFQNINVTNTWFDSKSEEWVFAWDSWLKEVSSTKGELPPALKDPDGYPQRADWIDIMILKELEKDSAVKLKEIAKKLGTSLQRVRYHFKYHVMKEKMFEGYQILADHFKGLCAEKYYFRFVFKNYENLVKFACSLLDKPFVRVIGKAYGQNQLFVQVYLPTQQLRNFLGALSKLVRGGFLDTYGYVIQDSAKTERETIPYQFFRDDNWVYEHERYLEKLRSTVKNL